MGGYDRMAYGTGSVAQKGRSGAYERARFWIMHEYHDLFPACLIR